MRGKIFKRVLIEALLLGPLVVACASGTSGPTEGATSTTEPVPVQNSSSNPALDDAIETLQRIDASTFERVEQQEFDRFVNGAWATISEAGDEGILRLRRELEREDTNTFFRMSGTALLFLLQGPDAASLIGEVWSRSDLTVHYHYVFHTAALAAYTGDPRVTEILAPLLSDASASMVFPAHVMRLRWPGLLKFTWGAMGPAGESHLLDVLRTSDDPAALRSAMHLLSDSFNTEALPELRRLSESSDKSVRTRALISLGEFGHPDDYDKIVAELRRGDDETSYAALYALWEFMDLRGANEAIPFLSSENSSVAIEAANVLHYLITPEGVDSLVDCAKSDTLGDTMRKKCAGFVANIWDFGKTTRKKYARMSRAQKQRFCDAYLQRRRDKRYRLTAEERLEREELLAFTEAMIEAHEDRFAPSSEMMAVLKRLEQENPPAEGTARSPSVRERYEGVPSVEAYLEMLEPQDVMLLRRLRSAMLWRQSDEALELADELQNGLRRIVRESYRESAGFMAQVK